MLWIRSRLGEIRVCTLEVAACVPAAVAVGQLIGEIAAQIGPLWSVARRLALHCALLGIAVRVVGRFVSHDSP
jgi:hypothetical protein